MQKGKKGMDSLAGQTLRIHEPITINSGPMGRLQKVGLKQDFDDLARDEHQPGDSMRALFADQGNSN